MTCLPIPGTPEYDRAFREIFQRIPRPDEPRQELPAIPVNQSDEEIRL